MDVFAALGDPVRREILALLGRRERSAGEISDHFEISRPAISRHLRVLRESGLVEDEVRGRHRQYRLVEGALAEVVEWVQTICETEWDPPLDALETEVYRTRRERRASRTDPNRRSA